MRKIILLSGQMASGKSTYSEILAKKFNITVLNKDSIKEILGDEIGFKNREENKRLSSATYQIMKYVFQKMIQSGNDLILESNFRTYELKELISISEKEGYDYHIFYLSGDHKTLFKRYRNRIENENRHPVHKTPNFQTIDEFEKYLNETNPDLKGLNVTLVNATNFDYQQDENIFKSVKEFLGK